MKKAFLISLSLSLVALSSAHATPPTQPKAPGIESPDYAWDEQSSEEAQMLKMKGDVAQGKIAYQGCQGCHKPDASGLPDGTYPQLAGQHTTVLIKQMSDVREGRRDNPKMFPFAGKHVVDTQEVADIAAYLNSLPLPGHNDKGPGSDLVRGKMLYERDCVSCHGEHGEGNAEKFYPVTNGQHYRYMVRQIVTIRDGSRRNAYPKMVKVVKNYSVSDIGAVADYMSRMELPAKAEK
ncbi:MAG: c-type cytochrome [Sulfurimicrobium sp.]|jgi:cytochrome c553|nr:c-type cytochrome [Sulfurimicrobium sp.]MDO9190665.1 c-type cytochrome [Sulfurimicrobium sp.]MDP1704317.1 c-type cytochrome [Sulfurimicrobium sp.]MDP2197543.1 c-type cytochrome [Sulfurimicrobium sp.]MDP2961840.1 c-type cytochrome [Sulfurimicrobium sp.]